MPVDLLAPKAPRDLLSAGPRDLLADIEKPKFDPLKTATETLFKLPLPSFTPEQLIKGQQVLSEVIERPVAGFRAMSKEGLNKFWEGVKSPEKYPVGTFATALTESGMEPISAGALGTLADAGYYFGMPEALGRIATTGKVKLLEGTIKNINEALKTAGETRTGVVNISQEAVDTLAKEKDIGSVVENYLKSKNIKLSRKDGLLEYKPESLRPPKDLLAPETPITAPKDLLAEPTPSGAEKAPVIEDLKGEKGNIQDFQDKVTAAQELSNTAKEQKYRISIDGNGYVTIYHGTSAENAQTINASGKIESQSFFSPNKKGAEFYGKTKNKSGEILPIKVDARDIEYSTGTGEIYAPEGLVKDTDGIWKSPKRIEQGKGETGQGGGIPIYIGKQEGKPQGKYIYGAENKDYAKNFGEQVNEQQITPQNTFDLTPLKETAISFDKLSNTLKQNGIEIDKSIIGDDDVYKPAWQWIRKYPAIADKIKEAGFDSIKQLETFTGKGKKELTYQVLDNKILSPKEGQPSPVTPKEIPTNKGKETFYTYDIVEGKYKPIEGRKVEIEGHKGVEAFVHKSIANKGYYVVSELTSGARFTKKYKTQKAAIEEAKNVLDKVEKEHPGRTKEAIEKFIKEHGKSPYGQPSTPSAPEKTGREGFIKVDMLNPTRWDSVRQFIEDDWLRVKRLIQQKGANVTDTNNPYEAEIRYWGRLGARTEEADRLISDIDKDIVTTSKKLNISNKLLNKEVDRFLIARHAPERNAKHGEGAAGMTDKQSYEIRAEIAGKPYAKEAERIADRIQELNNKTLDTLLEGEIITKELYDQLRTLYKNHIPLNRVMSEEDDIVEVLTKRGFDVQGAGLKRAKGSELEVADILTNVTANYKAALARAEKNIVDNYTLRLARENDYFDGLFEEIKLPMLPVGKVKHRAAVDSGYLQQVREFAEKLGAKVRTGGQPGRVLGTYGGKVVERKFATPEEVVSHEVGHFLDEKYKLKQQFYKKGDTKKVGEEIYQFMVDQGQSANRVKKVSERFAHAFEWWLSNRALAKEDLPLFTKSIEDIIAKIPELSPLLKIRPTPGLTVESITEMVFARQKYNTDPHVLPIREKGNQVYLKINDPQLAMALRGVNRQKVDGIMKGIKLFTRFYSGLMTRFNPEFAFSNKIRDLQETVIYLASKNEIGFKGAAEAITKDPQSMKDVTDYIRGKDTEGTRLYKQMKMDGGTTGGMGLSTREQLEIDLDRIRAINRSNPRKAAEIIFRSVDQWNTIFEDSTRLSVYRQALKQGVSRNKAAVLAKEASINFNKMGTGSPIINAAYMFSNASVQGTAKMLRAMRNPKVLATVLALVGGAVALVAEYNDRQDKDWRKKISKWDKLNGLNIVIKTNKGIRYITIPSHASSASWLR